jgi:hypothetical protein
MITLCGIIHIEALSVEQQYGIHSELNDKTLGKTMLAHRENLLLIVLLKLIIMIIKWLGGIPLAQNIPKPRQLSIYYRPS